MAAIDQIIARHNRYQDSLVYTFETHLREITARASARVIAQLQQRLKITNGLITPTPGNLVILRGAGKLFMNELDHAGYDRLVTAFVGEFKSLLPFLTETLEALADQAGQDWRLGFTAQDFNLLAGVQANTAWALEDAISSAAGTAVTRGLFSVAGLRFGSLVEMLSTRLHMSVGRARTLADTGMSNWYATASARAYDAITRDLPAQTLRYRYSGPQDKLERPFCRHLTEMDKGYTREQIARMDNEQLPNVFLTRGGWNCRHQWILDTRSLEAPAAVREISAA